jgi:hypothetical protein
LNDRIRSVAGTTIDGQRAFAFAISESVSDQASCAAFMFKRRWPDGFVCPACGKRRVAALKSRPRLHRSRLPLTTWFWAAHLMTTHSNGMSALQLQNQLGVTYKTAWLLTQKLRRSMVDPDREPLEGVVEVDQAEIAFREGDTFFESGNAGKILVVGAVEIIERERRRRWSEEQKRAIIAEAFAWRVGERGCPAHGCCSRTDLSLAPRAWRRRGGICRSNGVAVIAREVGDRCAGSRD